MDLEREDRNAVRRGHERVPRGPGLSALRSASRRIRPAAHAADRPTGPGVRSRWKERSVIPAAVWGCFSSSAPMAGFLRNPVHTQSCHPFSSQPVESKGLRASDSPAVCADSALMSLKCSRSAVEVFRTRRPGRNPRQIPGPAGIAATLSRRLPLQIRRSCGNFKGFKDSADRLGRGRAWPARA
jgi:hypothetical protein